jgi:hypothetical protein
MMHILTSRILLNLRENMYAAGISHEGNEHDYEMVGIVMADIIGRQLEELSPE